MKTSKLLKLSLVLAAVLVVGLTSCQKGKTTNPADTNTTSIQNVALDETQANAASDEAMADINIVLSGSMGLKSTEMLPCNATIDSMAITNDTMTYYVTYHGLNCIGNLYRSGKIEIKKHIGTRWYQVGASVTYKYIDFHVTHVRSQKSITLNGQKTYTNVTGGLIFMIPQFISSVTHKDQGYLTVTFDDNTTKSWNVARQITYTKVNNRFVLTTDGFGTADGYDNLVLWGTNRNSEQFYIQILQPVVHRQVCDFDPCSGQKKITIPGDNKGATLTFGYDNNNQPVTGNACPTKFKVDWYKNDKSGTIFLFLP